MSQTTKPTVTSRLRVTNSRTEAITVCLEPWGREYTLDSKESLEIIFEADEPGTPEVFYDPDRIVIYGWSDSVARVMR